ncbi:hypothetical protein N7540_013059 [Penicillium herquei]|nr:hypothetical protein N7540_013059 [Penicillium herquei]
MQLTPAPTHWAESATTVANNMIRTFSKSRRVGLMVSIGGGIPSATHDTRFGDYGEPVGFQWL